MRLFKKETLYYSSQGFSLVELMIALLISMVLILTVMIITTNFVSANRLTVQNNRVTQSLQQILTLIANDVRRGGYWANSINNLNGSSNLNPFTNGSLPLTKLTIPNSSCVLFTYDRDDNGTLNSAGTTALTGEHFGYRLYNNTIQALVVDANSDFVCTDTSTTAWIPLTDSTVLTVNSLNITANNSTVSLTGAHSITIQTITISIQGQSAGFSNSTTTLSQVVRVRNDLVV